MNVWEHVTNTVAAACGFFVGLYGGWSGTMTVLVIFMTADYILGCICALTGKSHKTEGGHFLSSVAFVGLLKKGVIMLVVLLAVQLDSAIGGTSPMFQTAATFYYLANEGISVVENCGLLGVPVPAVIRNALEALRERNDNVESKGDDKAQDGGQAAKPD